MKKGIVYRATLWILILSAFISCREEYEIIPPQLIQVSLPEYTSIEGFYLLNEGNMQANKASLDYYDYKTGTYRRNIFEEVNPDVAKGLGDVGNDLQIYGSKMYAVVNCSNKVDVLDANTARKIGQVNIPNCRFIRFHNGYAYVSSYAGPVSTDQTYKQTGYVAKIDTASLEIVDRCLVGMQPDELEIVGNKIYVANSGGYNPPEYDNTVSVIDIPSFTEIKKIEVVRNIYRLQADRHGQLWVSSRGDYYGLASALYCIDLRTDQVVDSLDIAVSNFYLDGDSLYLHSTEWNYDTMENEVTYGIVDVKERRIVTRNFITDGTEKSIKVPYGILVNPFTKDIYLTDARNYVNPGTLYCFDNKGKKKWSVRTGDVPAHFVFLGELKQTP